MTNGPASILKEPIPAGVFSAAAVLRRRPERIDVAELMADLIPDAWKDGKTNALAVLTALSAQRGHHPAMEHHTDSNRRRHSCAMDRVGPVTPPHGRVRWPVPSTQSFKSPTREGIREGNGSPYKPKPPGQLSAEAVLEAHGIQDLADQIPALTKAAVGSTLRFNVRIEFEGEAAPDVKVVNTINGLLSEVSEELKLN